MKSTIYVPNVNIQNIICCFFRTINRVPRIALFWALPWGGNIAKLQNFQLQDVFKPLQPWTTKKGKL